MLKKKKQITITKQKLPKKETMKYKGYNIGISHIHGFKTWAVNNKKKQKQHSLYLKYFKHFLTKMRTQHTECATKDFIFPISSVVA